MILPAIDTSVQAHDASIQVHDSSIQIQDASIADLYEKVNTIITFINGTDNAMNHESLYDYLASIIG